MKKMILFITFCVIGISTTIGRAATVKALEKGDQKVIDAIIAKKDSSLCTTDAGLKKNKSETRTRIKIDNCINQVALATNDPHQCIQTSRVPKSICVGSVAFELKKPEICDAFFKNDETFRKKCNFYATGENIKLIERRKKSKSRKKVQI